LKKYFLKKALVLNKIRLPVGTALNGFSMNKNKYGASTVLVEFNSNIFRIRRKNLIEFAIENASIIKASQAD